MSRAERRRRTERKRRQRLKQARELEYRPLELGPVGKGMLRHKSGLACGKARCMVCHHEKVLGIDRHIRRQMAKAGADQ